MGTVAPADLHPLSFQGRPLGARVPVVRRACVVPTRLGDDDTYTGAVYDDDGALVLASLRPAGLGHWRPIDPTSMRRSPDVGGGPARHYDEAVYGGHFFMGWGHFLFETLGTAWAATRAPTVPVLFAPFAADAMAPRIAARFEQCRPVLAAAGWGSRGLSLVTGPVTVTRLHVPERLTVFGLPWNRRATGAEMRDVHARLRTAFAPRPAERDVVAVAARPDGHPRRHPAERDLYEHLDRLGMTVLDGAYMTPVEQAHAFGAARTLIGFSGSNLHNSIFAAKGAKVVELTDIRSTAASEKRNRTQAALCEIADQDYMLLDAFTDGRSHTRNELSDMLSDAIEPALGEV